MWNHGGGKARLSNRQLCPPANVLPEGDGSLGMEVVDDTGTNVGLLLDKFIDIVGTGPRWLESIGYILAQGDLMKPPE